MMTNKRILKAVWLMWRVDTIAYLMAWTVACFLDDVARLYRYTAKL